MKEVFLSLARGQACLLKILQLQLLYISYFDGIDVDRGMLVS